MHIYNQYFILNKYKSKLCKPYGVMIQKRYMGKVSTIKEVVSKTKPPINSTEQTSQLPPKSDLPPINPVEAIQKQQKDPLPDHYIVKTETDKSAPSIKPHSFKPESSMEEKLQANNPNGVNILGTVYNAVASTVTSPNETETNKEDTGSTPEKVEMNLKNEQQNTSSSKTGVEETTKNAPTYDLEHVTKPKEYSGVITGAIANQIEPKGNSGAIMGTVVLNKNKSKDNYSHTEVHDKQTPDTKPSAETSSGVTATTSSSFSCDISEKLPVIPPAPSLDNYKSPKPKDPNAPNIVHTEQIKQLGELKDTNNDDNIKPSKIPITMKFKSITGKEFETIITEYTLVTDLTLNQFIEEFKKREFIKDDNGDTTVMIKLQDGSDFRLGLSKNGIKLTPLGQAYDELLPKTEDLIQEQKHPCPTIHTIKMIISAPPASTDNTIIDGGKQKHLLIIQNEENDTYVVIGYLTSKTTGEYLADKQFKAFQNEKIKEDENKDEDKTEKDVDKKEEKKQNVCIFDVPLEIDKKNVKEVKWDQEYFQEIPPENIVAMLQKLKSHWDKGIKSFPTDAITRERALHMCKEHDKIVKAKGKHPLTFDQVKQQEEAKKKQQDKQNMEKIKKHKDEEGKPNDNS
jgi:hypothetical protein